MNTLLPKDTFLDFGAILICKGDSTALANVVSDYASTYIHSDLKGKRTVALLY